MVSTLASVLVVLSPLSFAAAPSSPDGAVEGPVPVLVEGAGLTVAPEGPDDSRTRLECPASVSAPACTDAKARALALSVTRSDWKAFGEAAAAKREELLKTGAPMDEVDCSTAPLSTARAADSIGGSWEIVLLAAGGPRCGSVSGPRSLPGVLPDSIRFIVWPEYAGYAKDSHRAGARVLKIVKERGELSQVGAPSRPGGLSGFLKGLNPFAGSAAPLPDSVRCVPTANPANLDLDCVSAPR